MASPFEKPEPAEDEISVPAPNLNGYDLFEGEGPAHGYPEGWETVIVRCSSNDAIRAAAALDEDGHLRHIAVEPSEFGREAMQALAIRLGIDSATAPAGA